MVYTDNLNYRNMLIIRAIEHIDTESDRGVVFRSRISQPITGQYADAKVSHIEIYNKKARFLRSGFL